MSRFYKVVEKDPKMTGDEYKQMLVAVGAGSNLVFRSKSGTDMVRVKSVVPMFYAVAELEGEQATISYMTANSW